MRRGRYSEAQLLRIATRKGEPDAGLTAVAELRRRLDVWEATHVDEAVNNGWSWQRIADSLGVTRQAAHARHAKRREQAQGGLVVAGRARGVVRRAREEAARMGSETLETDHLLLGLLLDPADGPVKQALDACGITGEAVRARAQPPGARAAGRPEVSPEVRETLENSMREAVTRGEGRLDVEHLLLAVLHEPGGRGRQAVTAAGQSPGAVERRLNRALRAQSSPSPLPSS
jgi:Clp amino terminal domain, pathogenicity island component